MLLIDRQGERAETWSRVDGAAIEALPQALVRADALQEALAKLAPGQQLGVIIANTQSVAALRPALPLLSLIVVAFPSFGDGRGFSLGRLLRRNGYRGRLRGCGPLIPDQFPYALACGFDEIELPESSAARQTAQQWRQACAWQTPNYQRGYDRGASILDSRRRSRAAGAPT